MSVSLQTRSRVDKIITDKSIAIGTLLGIGMVIFSAVAIDIIVRYGSSLANHTSFSLPIDDIELIAIFTSLFGFLIGAHVFTAKVNLEEKLERIKKEKQKEKDKDLIEITPMPFHKPKA